MNHSKRLFSYGSAAMAPVNDEPVRAYAPARQMVVGQPQADQSSVQHAQPSKKLGIPGTGQVYYTSSERASMNAKQRLDRSSQLENQLGFDLMQFDDAGLCY